MNHRKLVILASMVFAASLPVMSAHGDSGIYVGAGAGVSNMQDSASNPGGVAFDESGTATKAFVGYYFDWIPLVKFAAEVGYRDLGKPSGTVAGVPVEYQASGFDYAALAGLGLGPIDLFARVGGMNYDLKKTVGSVSNDYTGNAPVYGIGVWFKIGGLGVRAEYDVIDIKQLDNADMATVSVFYQF